MSVADKHKSYSLALLSSDSTKQLAGKRSVQVMVYARGREVFTAISSV